MTAERKKIIFLAGYSAAGKSTLGRELRDNWGYSLIEHHPILHGIAVYKGHGRVRNWLAAAGASQFAAECTNEIVSRTHSAFDQGTAKVVHDAAYGMEMLDTFHKVFPDLCVLVVSLVTHENARLKNIQKRMGTESTSEAQKEMHFRDGFLREVGLEDVLKRSDIEIASRQRPAREIASELNELIEEHTQPK